MIPQARKLLQPRCEKGRGLKVEVFQEKVYLGIARLTVPSSGLLVAHEEQRN